MNAIPRYRNPKAAPPKVIGDENESHYVGGKKVIVENVEYERPFRLIGQRSKEWQYANVEHKAWRRSYLVSFDDHTNYGILVNADAEDEALDYAADFAEEMGWEGYFADNIDDPDPVNADLGDDENNDDSDDGYEFVGTSGRKVRSDEVKIFEVTTPPPATPLRKRVTYHGGRPVKS